MIFFSFTYSGPSQMVENELIIIDLFQTFSAFIFFIILSSLK